MKPVDAAKVLGLNGELNPEIVKQAYRKASTKYHPDKGGSHEMMSAVNQAYEVLKNFKGSVDVGKDGGYSDLLNSAINAVVDLEGVIIEVCGAWVWLTGETKQHAKKLGRNGAGFFYARKKQAWYFRPSEWKSKSRGNWSLDDIRTTHGSKTVRGKQGVFLRQAGA